jgi:hypothetical protein
VERRLVFTHVFKHPISVFSATPIVKRFKLCMTSNPDTRAVSIKTPSLIQCQYVLLARKLRCFWAFLRFRA